MSLTAVEREAVERIRKDTAEDKQYMADCFNDGILDPQPLSTETLLAIIDRLALAVKSAENRLALAGQEEAGHGK